MGEISRELENQFGSGEQETAVQCLFAVPSMLVASKKTWMTSFGWFSTFHEDLLPSPLDLDAKMTLWQREWERQDPSATLKKIDHTIYPNITVPQNIFHLTSHHMRAWKECVSFEATENIFTLYDVTDEIDRTCLAAQSLQHGHWLWQNNSQICQASSKKNGTGKYIAWLTQKARKGHFRLLKLKNFPGEHAPGPP